MGSTTGNIEGQAFLAMGQLPLVSEQELVSCDWVDGGCKGGFMHQAFDWLINERAGQIVTEDYYPYFSSGWNSSGICGGRTGEALICKGTASYSDAWCSNTCNCRWQDCRTGHDSDDCKTNCDCTPTGEHVAATISGWQQ